MTRRRFFVTKFHQGRAVLTGSAAHHLARVLRARPGQRYELCDQGEVWLARITGVKPHRVEFELLEKLGPAEEAPRLVLLAAVIKFARFSGFWRKLPNSA